MGNTSLLAAEALMSLTRAGPAVPHSPSHAVETAWTASARTDGNVHAASPTSIMQHAAVTVVGATEKRRGGIRWNEPIKLSPTTVYGTQHAMRATGGFAHTAPSEQLAAFTAATLLVATPCEHEIESTASTASSPRSAIMTSPRTSPCVGVLPSPSPPSHTPEACGLKWVTHGSKPKQLLGDGRVSAAAG